MKRQNLSMSWYFTLNGGGEAVIDLPHDFSIGQPRTADSRMLDKGGFFQGGSGIYRKTLPAGKPAKAVLEVEGAYMNTEVFVNGNLAAFHPYGYTSFHADLTPWLLEDAPNELQIRVHNNALPNSRWYSGSGLYRPVWLLVAEGAHIAPWGVFASTVEATEQRALLRAETQLCGAGLLRHSLLDASGAAVAVCEAQAEGLNVQELAVAQPRLWGVDAPNLYTLRSELLVDGVVVDSVDTVVGIRTIALDKTQGFLLNGKPLKLKGGCVHHDCGILGSAAWRAAEERKARALKDAGYNAVRCAHNPPSVDFLDACDRIGLVVMDEAFDCWRMGKTPYDYHLYFEDWWQRDLTSMVLRDRNHPSIAFWSTGNEITERFGRSGGYELARRLAAAVRELDSTRFVSNALCGAFEYPEGEWGESSAPFAAPLDVVGYNYLWRRYEEDLQRFPDRFILGTETIAGEAWETWQATLADPRVIGDCVWTSMDYIGEAGIGHSFLPDEDGRTHGLGFPWHLANCGDLDILCRPRPQSYYRQILWGHRKAPWIAVHRPNAKGIKPSYNYWGWSDVHHSWSWPGADGYKTYIDVYSDADEVELIVNGVSLGRQPAGAVARNIASFETVYAPGSVKAVAYVDGKAVSEDAVQTCGAPAAIRLDADRAQMEAGWQGLAYVTATVVDAQGQTVPYAGNMLYFAASGAGALAAVGTNDPVSREPYTGNSRSVFEGTAVCAIRSQGQPGAVTLTVSAEGLQSAQLVLQAI